MGTWGEKVFSKQDAKTYPIRETTDKFSFITFKTSTQQKTQNQK